MSSRNHHVQRTASALTRCGGCGRLCQRDTAKPGPGGRSYGPCCLVRANFASSAPLIPAEYMPSCGMVDTDGCDTPRSNVDWSEDHAAFLCANHRRIPKN